MRQDRKSLSMLDIPDLPAEAFQHVGNRKIKLHGGGNPISDIVNGIGDAISSIGSAVDDFVSDVIPGGWAGVAAVTLLAAGIYDPELLAAADEGTLTTGMLENAGYDAMAVADGVTTVAPEVSAATEAALSSGVSPEMIAMANGTADPIAALNAAAGWTASDPAYLMSIGYTGAIVDPVTGMSTNVDAAARAQNAGWTSASNSGVPGGVWQDANGVVFDAAGNPLTAGEYSADIASSVHTTQGGISGTQITDSAGNTWFTPDAPSNLPPPEAPHIADIASGPAAPANQSIVAGTQTGSQIPGAYSVDSAGTYYDVNGNMVAQTSANGSVVGTDGIQYVEPTATAPVQGPMQAGPGPINGPVAPNPVQVPITNNPVVNSSTIWDPMGADATGVQTTYANGSVEYVGSNGSTYHLENGVWQAGAAPAVPANTIPVTLSDGSIGAFDPATNTVYNSAGAIDTGATETMQTAASGSTAGPGTQLAEAAKDTGVVSDVPYRVEVTGAAGTAEAPSFVTGPLTEGSQLATQAEIDAGTATWNPAANAWEVASTPAELSPVVPTEVATGAGGVAASHVTPVVVGGGLTAAQTAALGAGGLAAASALGGGAAGAAPIATTTGGTAATTGGSPATVVSPSGDIVSTTTTPATTPLSPVQPGTVPSGAVTPVEVIPPGSSAVASVTAPPAGITTAEQAAAAGFDASTVAKWVAGGLIAAAVLPAILNPGVPTPAGYGPLNKHYPFGTADKMVNPGLNPGWITAQPFYNTTSPVQSQYYWGNHPYTETPADLANWNNIPYASSTPWGLQQPQAPFDVNTYIRQTMTPQQQAALAGTAPQYYGPVAPATPAAGGTV